MWVIATLMLAMTLVPGKGVLGGGAHRWIRGPMGFHIEPSEIFKIAFVFVMATFISQEQKILGALKWPVRFVVVLLPLMILIKQPDFGSVAICMITLLSLLFVFGLRWRSIFGSILVSLPVFWFLVWQVAYRKNRILSFLDPWSDPARGGFQVIQSMLGFHSGGFWGVGLGEGQSKLFFLPEAHTDFILSVLAEEWGFIGVVFVLIIYGFLIFKGLQIGTRSGERFMQACGLGLTLLFAFQVCVNVGVVMGLLPTKGLALPFLSSGGSSLIANCILFGILLNIQRQKGQIRESI